MLREVERFLDEWEDSALQVKKSFVLLKDYVADRTDLTFNFKARPGVSYSLRVKHRLQKSRELFLIMDVIDEPENRWLSICFYPDMITDPDDKGVLIPLGLLGEDGYCFDLEEWDEEYLQYLKTRLDEAYEKASHIPHPAKLNQRRQNMSQIKIEHEPDEDLLKDLGVWNWPIWTKEVSEFPWQYDAQETCYLLEGDVIVTPEGGEPVEIKKGDLVTFPKGMKCRWNIRSDVRKHYTFE